MKTLAEAQVTIVGLGLMGGSLAGALRDRCRLVVGVARRLETVSYALEMELIDFGTTDTASGVQSADIVILATPVRTILHLLPEIGPMLPDGCLLMDLGSTKTEIVAEMDRLPDHVQPLGGHPMCGKEVSGIAAADSALYGGCSFVLTPLPRTSDEALSLGQAMVNASGANPLILEAARHDHLVAAISHLPYLLACALVDTAAAEAQVDPAIWQLAASGFRDTSRLAASDGRMMLDILLTNREAVLEALNSYQAQLRSLAHLLEVGDEDGLRKALATASQHRAGWQMVREGQ